MMAELYLGLEDWIDFLAGLWDYKWNGTQITTYKVWGRDSYPEKLDIPCVLTFLEEDAGLYSQGQGGGFSLIGGVTEFHLFEGPTRSNAPAIMPLFEEIVKTAAKNMGLNHPGQLVFLLTEDAQGRIRGPLGLQWGDEVHLGLTVHWTVHNNQSFQVSLQP